MTTRDRLALATALSVALASSALTPVYEDLGWLPRVLGAVAAVAGAGALSRLVHAPRALQPVAGLLALGGFVTLTFAGSTLRYGVLPSLTTASSITATFTGGLEDVRSLAPPVPSTPGLVLLAVLGTGAITVVVDLLAVVLRKAAVSGLPLLLLFAVPSAVLHDGLGVLPFLLGAAGWLGLLMADSSDRATRWGTPLSSARRSTSDPSLGQVGRRIGAAALGVAAVVPALVPGIDGPLLGGADGARGTVTYDPMTELAGWLRQGERRSLFTYRSAAGPVFLRRTTLDVYDPGKGTFTASEPSVDDDAVQDGVPAPEGLTAPTDALDVEVALTGQLGGSYLPVPPTPTDIDVDGEWLWDAEAETVFSTRRSLLDIDAPYEVRAARVRTDATLLRRRQTVPADIRKTYAKDPELSDYAQALLDRTTAGLGNDFDRVTAVQRLFRETDFVYSTRTPPGSPDKLTAFLQNRQGYCQQYASAMAALVRGLGIPARVATGFTGGSRIGPGRYQVTTRDAHAWPEVWFEGAGWVRFEPTPRDDDVRVDAPSYSLVPPLQAATEAAGAQPSSAPTTPSAAGGARADQSDRAAADGASTPQGSQLEEDVSRWWLALPAAVVLLALPSALAAVRRRLAWRCTDAHVAWRCVRDDAVDVGHRWHPADSPRSAATHLLQVRQLPNDAAEALGRLAAEVERARYARTPAPADASQLRRDADTVRAALHAGASREARWVARLLPPSTLRWAGSRSSTTSADLLDRSSTALSAVGARLRHPHGRGPPPGRLNRAGLAAPGRRQPLGSAALIARASVVPGAWARCGRMARVGPGPCRTTPVRREPQEGWGRGMVDLRRRWSEGQPCHGLWSTLPGAVTGEVLALTGADFVVVDLQHGGTAEAELPGVTAAVAAAGSVPLVRTRSPVFADVGRPLDLGARGVIVPNVRDADHARDVVAASRYAPDGGRSIGGLFGGADEPLVIAMVETASALDDLDALLAVKGLDGVYVGPGDLALSMELTGADRRAELREVLSSIIARAVHAGVPVGVHAYSGEEAAGYAAEGATIVTVAVDAVSLRGVMAHHLSVARDLSEPGGAVPAS